MPERSRKHGGARHKSVRRSTARKLKMRQHNRSSREYNKTMFVQPIRKFKTSEQKRINENERRHAANMNALVGAMSASHVSARSATRQRLLSQKKSQANPFKLAAFKQQMKGKKLNTINKLSNLLGSMTAKFSTVRRTKKSKMAVSPTRRSTRHSSKK